jgi:hypothetical protein
MAIKNTLTPTIDVQIKQKNGTVIKDTIVNVPTEIVKVSTNGIENISGASTPPIGRCIYCGALENLSKEHIVPFGLSGSAVLQKASCPRCSDITSKFEEKVLRGPMVEVRKLLGLQSRSKHKKPSLNTELTLIKDGNEIVLNIPMSEYPIILSFPTFGVPHYISGIAQLGISLNGVIAISFGPRPEEVLQRYNAQKIIIPEKPSEPIAFARMLAKIAYCFAVSNDELSKLNGPCAVLPAILGESDDIGYWVGTLDGPLRTYDSLLHRIAIHADEEKGLLIAEVQLFASSPTPTYGVILGRLRSITNKNL